MIEKQELSNLQDISCRWLLCQALDVKATQVNLAFDGSKMNISFFAAGERARTLSLVDQQARKLLQDLERRCTAFFGGAAQDCPTRWEGSFQVVTAETKYMITCVILPERAAPFSAFVSLRKISCPRASGVSGKPPVAAIRPFNSFVKSLRGQCGV